MENILDDQKKNRFNLVDEPWIPVVDAGKVSLRQIFTNPHYRALSGNPVQKIALTKLLLAIAQAAYTPKDEPQWRELGAHGLAAHCLTYLEQWYDHFWLYGEKPFLQMPKIAKATLQNYGVVQIEVSTGNTTILTQTQKESILDHSERALLLIILMGFALGGKKTDNSIILTTGYLGKTTDKGKPSSGKPGPAIAHMGLLHSFLLGQNIVGSLWLNLFTLNQIEQQHIFSQGCGVAPWEAMPEGEACIIAQRLQKSLMGCLVPLSRFCLLAENGIYYSEGLAYLGYKDGFFDPMTAIDYTSKKAKALWANPEKRPWRELTALLNFFHEQKINGFQCWQIKSHMDRTCNAVEEFALWSGGLKVSSNAGEQYVSGNDDFVESQISLHSGILGKAWFAQLQVEMTALDTIAKSLYGCVMAYYKELLVDGSKTAPQATQLFWQLCERDFQLLLDHCNIIEEGNLTQLYKLRQQFANYIFSTYDRYCPNSTTRQLTAWVKCRPNLGKYLMKQEN